MNKYLEKIAEVVGMEKIALNALKARAMAKAVGVIPDPITNWKYALRNLRGPRGEAKTGKALQDAKTRLGVIHSDSFKKIQEMQHKHPNRELGFSVDTKGQVDKIGVGGKHSTKNAFDGLPNNSLNHRLGHSHELHGDVYKHLHTPRIAMPSGLDQSKLPLVKRDMDDVRHTDKVLRMLHKENAPDKKIIHVLNTYTKPPVGRIVDGKMQPGLIHGRDVGTMISHPQTHNSPVNSSRYNIVSPELGVDAVHKVHGVINENLGTVHMLKHRTVMFKHD